MAVVALMTVDAVAILVADVVAVAAGAAASAATVAVAVAVAGTLSASRLVAADHHRQTSLVRHHCCRLGLENHLVCLVRQMWWPVW